MSVLYVLGEYSSQEKSFCESRRSVILHIHAANLDAVIAVHGDNEKKGLVFDITYYQQWYKLCGN